MDSSVPTDKKHHQLERQNGGGFEWGPFSARFPTQMERQPFLLHSVEFCFFLPYVLVFHLPTNHASEAET
jgi:hypothetical protein